MCSSDLSGGERVRLCMVKLLLQPVNLLILDEPTNHLDLRSKDVLKEAIRDFDGTVIVVSHDRDFLDGLVTRVYEFGGGVVREHIGGIYDFLHERQIESLAQLGTTGSPSQGTTAPVAAPEAQKSASKLSYEEQKAVARQRKKLENALAQAEERVTTLEAAVKMLEDRMATPEGAADTQLFEQYGKLKHQLAEAEEEWAEAAEALEAFS